MSDNNSGAPGPAGGGSKRKWQTGMMKVWPGTDPTSVAPEVHHRDPKAAARAEQRKKQKVEPPKPRPKPDFRVPMPGKRGSTHISPTTVSSSKPPLNMGDLLTMAGEGVELTGENSGHAHSTASARNITRDSADTPSVTSVRVVSLRDRGPSAPIGEAPCTSQVAGHATESATRECEKSMATHAPCVGFTESTPCEDAAIAAAPPTAQDCRPNGGEPMDVTTDIDSMKASLSGYAQYASDSGNDVRKWLSSAPPGVPTDLLADLMRTLDLGENAGDSFNTGWRRFGPRGNKLTNYVREFKDIPLVHWKSGLTTIAPFIPHEGPTLPPKENPTMRITGKAATSKTNKLRWDQQYVEAAAASLEDSRMRPDLCKHVKYTTDEEAANLIRECMAMGKPLLFDDFPASLRSAHGCTTVDDDPMMRPIAWSQDPTKGVVGANLRTPRDFQDASIRELNMDHPYVTSTLLDFQAWIRTPGRVGCILDLSCGFRQADHITDHIADNVIECMTNSFNNKYAGRFTIVGDMMKTQDWFLLHTSGFLTFGHIDASGMATSAQIRGSGLKEWMVFFGRNWPVASSSSTREDLLALQRRLVTMMRDLIHAAASRDLKPEVRKEVTASGSTSGEAKASAAPETVEMDGCVIELRPGMMYYQPAGIVHAAYTPVPTAAAGKHFFTFDDLHRVELCRRVQMAEDRLTNHNHNCGVQLMLIFMAAALPARAASGQVFRRKPMIALALMLTRPYEYMPEEKLVKVADPRKSRKKRKGETTAEAEARFASEDQQRKEDAKHNAERQDECDMTTRLRSPTWADDGTAFDRLAYTVARRILLNCETSYTSADGDDEPGPEYIMEGASWEDPGPILDVAQFTEELLCTHVDDIRPTTYA